MRRITFFILLLLVFVTSVTRAERIAEIKQYFELRDTLSLVNLEMKRALAPDAESENLTESEQGLTRLVMFLEQRVKEFSKINSAFKYHYTRNLEKLLLETRFLYANLIARIRATSKAPVAPAKAETETDLKVKPRPYFHPIDVRTLLSPSLFESFSQTIKQKQPQTEIISAKTDNSFVEAVKQTDPAAKGKDPVTVPEKELVRNETSLSMIEAKPVSVKSPEIEKSTETRVTEVEPAPTTEPDKKEIPALKTTKDKIEVIAPPPVTVIQTEPVASNSTDPAKPAKVTKAMRPLAVMIENHQKARPQSGLIDAELVYDIPVEGGITRFMAIFYHIPGILGPIRSCREYFVDRALEIDALYVHCGGSPKGYAYLAKTKIASIDEIKLGKPFYRDKSRKAPHNLYTHGKKLVDFMADRYPMQVSNQKKPLNYGPVPTKGKKKGLSVKIHYHGNNITEYKFNKNSYDRFINGKKHIDRETKKIISPGSVIVQTAAMKTVDRQGRQEITFIGSGTARILHQGTMIEATWHKSDPCSRSLFKDLSGKEIVFSDKQPVWIQVVSPKQKVIYNQGNNDSITAQKD